MKFIILVSNLKDLAFTPEKNPECKKYYAKGGFSKLCVKIKKRCYTDLLHFSTRMHNLVSFFGRIVF
jgi:hypothetical protein